MSTSLVLLPTYNERENLSRVLPRLKALEDEVDVLVIDDASPDGTGELAEELRFEYEHLSVLHRKKKEGLGRAYVHGFKEALRRGYSRIVTMDADLSHSPEDVPRLLWALEEADVAIGSRHAPGGGVKGWPLARQILSAAGSLYARTALWLSVSDVTSGFRAYRADALGELDLERLRSRGFAFQVEVLRRILDLPGARAIEVPIVFQNRAEGFSKLTGGVIREATLEVLSLALRRRRVPERKYAPFGSRRVFEPVVTVVIPTRPEAPEPEALLGVSSLEHPPQKLEVLVARGRSPSLERNLAVEKAMGDFILFLDDDSTPSANLLSVYLSAFQRDPTLGAIGGPAETQVLEPFEALGRAVLGERWVLGRSAARYRALGRARFSDEREVILCNLCVRRTAFDDVGGFNEALYPNEENEFLERLRHRGWRILYRPDAVVTRPGRRTLWELLFSVHRYGMGRAAQLYSLPSWTSLSRVALVLLGLVILAVAGAGACVGSRLLASPALLYGLYMLLLLGKLSFRKGVRQGVLAAILGAFLQGSYALGVLRGLFFPLPQKDLGVVTVERWERSGESHRLRRVA